jgi:hypothetical protein
MLKIPPLQQRQENDEFKASLGCIYPISKKSPTKTKNLIQKNFFIYH